MSDAAPPPFDPSKPFTQGGTTPPPFDPSKPFTPAGGQPKQPAQQGIGESLWQGLQNFGKGVAGGLAGEGVPAGRASEFSGGQSGFGGRMLGAGARSIGEGLWEAIKTPGQYASGEKQPGPQSPAEGLSTALLMAGQGGRRPMVPPRPEVPPPKPLLALPPPTVQVPGQAWTGTGVAPAEFSRTATGILERGNDPMMRAALERLPQPGLVPPGPSATMTTPAATPMMGQPARTAAPTPAPVPTSPLADATTSPISKAFASNDGGAIDRTLTGAYRTAVQPGRPMRRAFSGLQEQDRRIMTAVDSIIANKGNLRVSNADGQLIPLPARPSLKQFSEAIGENKKQVFKEYDAKTRAAGEAGVTVDLAPVISTLREVATKPEVVDLHPAIAKEATRIADQWERQRTFTPSEAQDMIESLNQTVGPGVMSDSIVSHRAVANEVRRALLGQLDKTITDANIPEFRAARNQYGALRSIEADVANAVAREANKRSGGWVGNFTNVISAEELLRGVITMNPQAIATAAGLKGAQMAIRYINEPNRAIGRMFERRSTNVSRDPYSLGRSGYGQEGVNRGSAAIGGFGAGVNDPDSRRGPMGGEIVGQRSIQRPSSGYPSL